MNESILIDKLKKILTFNGVSLIIGIIGSLASILTIFITQWNLEISIKWLVFVIFCSLSIILFLIKLVIYLIEEIKMKRPNTSSILSYKPDIQTLLVRNNDFLGHSAMVSIFYIDDSYEVNVGTGYVNNIQEKFTQIKILEIEADFLSRYDEVFNKIALNDVTFLQKLLIKNYIAYK